MDGTPAGRRPGWLFKIVHILALRSTKSHHAERLVNPKVRAQIFGY
jgi:hypothetical protein